MKKVTLIFSLFVKARGKIFKFFPSFPFLCVSGFTVFLLIYIHDSSFSIEYKQHYKLETYLCSFPD